MDDLNFLLSDVYYYILKFNVCKWEKHVNDRKNVR